ncbi:MAG: permease [Alphaproteobacteria bacterium]|nr:permease [Alphaproteobacteria bacterium]
MKCCAECGCKPKAASRNTTLWIGGTIFGLIVWTAVYSQLLPFAEWAVSVLPIPVSGKLHEAVLFFLYDTPKVFLLLTLVVFLMGIVRSFFSPERTRALLAGNREGLGNVAAALLGVVTPFCSCSAVPLFIGFLSAGVPLGITFSFLISAPMINEVALGLLFGLVGWKVALAYLVLGLGIAIASGLVLGRMHLENGLEDWVRKTQVAPPLQDGAKMTAIDRIEAGVDAVQDIIGKVWPWMIAGIGIGAFIHGYVPSELLGSLMSKDTWWSVPAVVALGVPMYSNAAGIIPVAEALLEKGAALGTVLAFMMAVIALSLPEMIILRKVLKPQLLAVFFGIVAVGILIVGYLFNALFT